MRVAFSIIRAFLRLCGAIADVLRPSHRNKAQDAGQINADSATDPNDPYQVLGVSRDVTEKELTARYRQLLRVNHPDKVAQLDPEIQEFANERSRRIIEAYQALSHLRHPRRAVNAA
jgi:DnaJ-domain-containing protein 1